MPQFAAVIGAGEIGGATLQAIAALDCVGEVRLIDACAAAAAGKALDAMQAAACESHSTRIVGAGDLRAASGAAAIVLADTFGPPSREWPAEEGLQALRTLWDLIAPEGGVIVCAGPSHSELMRVAVRELHIDRRRIVGTAPAAFESAARALVGIALDETGTDVSLMVLGLPPDAAVPCWSQGAVNGAALTSRLTAAQIAALDSRLPKLWPPGPYALGSAAAHAVRACIYGARAPLTLSVSLDGEMNMRNVVAALPVRLEPGGVVEVIEPELSPHDRVRLMAMEG